MIANFEYGDFDITLCDKYKITNYKDSVLNSGVYDGSIYVREETDDLEEVFDYFSTATTRKKVKLPSGTKIGFFNPGDHNYDTEDGGYRLDGEVIFKSKSKLYHDSGNDDCTGEVSSWVVMLDDEKFLYGGGEYSIITKENSEDELNKFNQAIGKSFDIIILSNS
jgi:hypothetical protein